MADATTMPAGAPSTPILDHGCAILDRRDSFGGFLRRP
jgi:hypothetical protein